MVLKKFTSYKTIRWMCMKYGTRQSILTRHIDCNKCQWQNDVIKALLHNELNDLIELLKKKCEKCFRSKYFSVGS